MNTKAARIAEFTKQLELVDERFDLSEDEIASAILGRNGDVYVWITYRDRGDYCGIVFVPGGESWAFDDYHAPKYLTADSPLQGGYDCEVALLHMMSGAVAFADYFTSGGGEADREESWNRYGEYFSSHAWGEETEDQELVFTRVP